MSNYVTSAKTSYTWQREEKSSILPPTTNLFFFLLYMHVILPAILFQSLKTDSRPNQIHTLTTGDNLHPGAMAKLYPTLSARDDTTCSASACLLACWLNRKLGGRAGGGAQESYKVQRCNE